MYNLSKIFVAIHITEITDADANKFNQFKIGGRNGFIVSDIFRVFDFQKIHHAKKLRSLLPKGSSSKV